VNDPFEKPPTNRELSLMQDLDEAQFHSREVEEQLHGLWLEMKEDLTRGMGEERVARVVMRRLVEVLGKERLAQLDREWEAELAAGERALAVAR
jgi:hypothetical protein